MKSISTLAVIGLLFFACKLCSFTGNNNNRPIDVQTSPRNLMYARDFIKPKLGAFTLEKSYTKSEARATATGFTLKLIDQSGDTAGGTYKTYGNRTAALMASSYSSTSSAASLVDEIESGLRADRAWKSIRTLPKSTGKRIEGADGRGNGLVIWNNGYWVFLTIGDSLIDASSLADNVGY
jgi:hypothetical protein